MLTHCSYLQRLPRAILIRRRRHTLLKLEGWSEESAKAKHLWSLSSLLLFFVIICFLNDWVFTWTFFISSHPHPDHHRLCPPSPPLPLHSFVWEAQSHFWRLFPCPWRKCSASYCSAVNTNSTRSYDWGKTWVSPKDEEDNCLFCGAKCNGSRRHKHFSLAQSKKDAYQVLLCLMQHASAVMCIVHENIKVCRATALRLMCVV